MHFTDYWAIVERDHTIQNPSSPAKLARLAEYCGVRDGLRVLDVGCGKAWMLRSWAQQWSIDATGLEINPHFVAAARAEIAAADLVEQVQVIAGPAAEFVPEPASYDIVTCIGASFAIGSFEDALGCMRRAVKPDGVLAIGDVYAIETPLPPEARPEQPPDLQARVATLRAHGLDLIGLISAEDEDWDHYVSQHWRTVATWSRANPDYPDRQYVVDQIKTAQARYFAWERRYLGWAIFVARPA